MKKLILGLGALTLFAWNTMAYAAFVSGSNGALGAFNPSANTEVELPPDGILNYTTVNIPAGVTVTFKNNSANTPVYMLATGDVTISGVINASSIALDITKAGPGGFDGGHSAPPGSIGGKGMGPGGGGPGIPGTRAGGAGGGFGTDGTSYYSAVGGTSYGNATLLPLIGGSGGGGSGWYDANTGSGGGGGGAILIASSTSINVTGSISVDGRNGSTGTYYTFSDGGSGSGGAIKLVANQITGNGTISAKGGSGAAPGGYGRIRLEAYTNLRTAASSPPYSFGSPGNIFVTNAPNLRITSIAGITVPSSTTGSYSQPDVLLPSATVNPVTVGISSANIPPGTSVKVSVIPQYGNATSVNTTLAGTQQASTATASVTLTTNYTNVITAEATFTVVAMYFNGEEIDKIRVATRLGGNTETTYITKSGKEIRG